MRPTRELKNSTAGFTLIETLIYVAFFTMLIGTLLSITYQTIASTDQVNRKITIQQEGNFLLKKIDWALTGLDLAANGGNPIALPSSGTGNILQAYKYGFAQSPISFSQNGSSLEMSVQGGLPVKLNSSNVIVSNFLVNHYTVSGKEFVEVDFILNGEQFKLTKYVRK